MFGNVMWAIESHMAVAYECCKDFDTTPQVYNCIRATYDGPLSVAAAFMVWRITKDASENLGREFPYPENQID